MKSRGIYLSNSSIICLAPSPIGRPAFASVFVSVEVTVNGFDYSESDIKFRYSEPCDPGFFCPGLGRSLCPNGTFCRAGSSAPQDCPTGTFGARPMLRQESECTACPAGTACPAKDSPLGSPEASSRPNTHACGTCMRDLTDRVPC